MPDFFDVAFDALRSAEQEFPIQLAQANTAGQVELVRVKYLGRKSVVASAFSNLPKLNPEQRAQVGALANKLQKSLQEEVSHRLKQIESMASVQMLDVTLPGSPVAQGRLHPVTQTLAAIVNVFVPMGFDVVQGPELEYEANNFDALNIPRDHPSRESFDTFFVDAPSPEPQLGRLLLRSHTSPVQVRVMKARKPPLRVLVPGKVYRPDPLDAGHSFMFHQVEGLLVDEQTTFAHLKGVLEQFLERLFGRGTATRFRPHFFPFTEPSAEVDIRCVGCAGRGCAMCGRKGWIEIMGCGMVHPNVFKAVGYPAGRVQGFAFGMGVERIAMLKYGIHDIRMFFENDLRFLEQF